MVISLYTVRLVPLEYWHTLHKLGHLWALAPDALPVASPRHPWHLVYAEFTPWALDGAA